MFGWNFRIALGGASAAGFEKMGSPDREICQRLLELIERFKAIKVDDLGSLPGSEFTLEECAGEVVEFTVYKADLPGGAILVVVQAFLSTWRGPTFISFGRVGRIYAEGFVQDTVGVQKQAPEEMLWPYR